MQSLSSRFPETCIRIIRPISPTIFSFASFAPHSLTKNIEFETFDLK